MSETRLSADEISKADLSRWRRVGDTLQSTFQTGNFLSGLNFVNLIGEAAERRQHHPDIVLTYPQVRVELTTHDAAGITQLDVELAREIDSIANQLKLA